MKYTGQYIVSRNINDCRFDLPFTLLSGVNDNTRVKPSCKGRKNLKTKSLKGSWHQGISSRGTGTVAMNRVMKKYLTEKKIWKFIKL